MASLSRARGLSRAARPPTTPRRALRPHRGVIARSFLLASSVSRPAGQHRWVEYADIHNYDAAMISPDWHGWMHHMTDSPGTDSAGYLEQKLKDAIQIGTDSNAPYTDHVGKQGARVRGETTNERARKTTPHKRPSARARSETPRQARAVAPFPLRPARETPPVARCCRARVPVGSGCCWRSLLSLVFRPARATPATPVASAPHSPVTRNNRLTLTVLPCCGGTFAPIARSGAVPLAARALAPRLPPRRARNPLSLARADYEDEFMHNWSQFRHRGYKMGSLHMDGTEEERFWTQPGHMLNDLNTKTTAYNRPEARRRRGVVGARSSIEREQRVRVMSSRVARAPASGVRARSRPCCAVGVERLHTCAPSCSPRVLTTRAESDRTRAVVVLVARRTAGEERHVCRPRRSEHASPSPAQGSLVFYQREGARSERSRGDTELCRRRRRQGFVARRSLTLPLALRTENSEGTCAGGGQSRWS